MAEVQLSKQLAAENGFEMLQKSVCCLEQFVEELRNGIGPKTADSTAKGKLALSLSFAAFLGALPQRYAELRGRIETVKNSLTEALI